MYSIRLHETDYAQFSPYWLLYDTGKTPNIDYYKGILANLKSQGTKAQEDTKRDMLKKADVYALGLVLSESYSILTKIYQTDDKTFSNVKNMKQKDNISEPIFNLINNMTNPDFRLRITAKDARIAYEDILMGMVDYFT